MRGVRYVGGTLRISPPLPVLLCYPVVQKLPLPPLRLPPFLHLSFLGPPFRFYSLLTAARLFLGRGHLLAMRRALVAIRPSLPLLLPPAEFFRLLLCRHLGGGFPRVLHHPHVPLGPVVPVGVPPRGVPVGRSPPGALLLLGGLWYCLSFLSVPHIAGFCGLAAGLTHSGLSTTPPSVGRGRTTTRTTCLTAARHTGGLTGLLGGTLRRQTLLLLELPSRPRLVLDQGGGAEIGATRNRELGDQGVDHPFHRKEVQAKGVGG